MTTYVWDIRNPDGASMGLEVARGRSAAHQVVLAHALPERCDVTVTDDSGAVIARGDDLRGGQDSPLARLSVVEGGIERENIWPGDADLDLPVILPGGEIGILESWWHADDHSEWRWRIELSNHV